MLQTALVVGEVLQMPKEDVSSLPAAAPASVIAAVGFLSAALFALSSCSAAWQTVVVQH